MNRISIYNELNYCESQYIGWFDLDSAKKIAEYSNGDPYHNGKILFATSGGKLVVNEWSNTGYDSYRFANDEKEISEILSKGGYSDNDKRMIDILKKFEI